MAPPPPKTHIYVPEHLFHTILHHLPFKCLNKMKYISKNTYSLISHDAKFAADQSHSTDTLSSGFVYMTNGGILSFFPDPSLIGVPDSSLNFLNPTSPTEIKLVTATNGLLLLYGEFSGMKSLCVCNPAIKEMSFVPYANQYVICELGLAYDPSELPDKYIIVDPLLNRRDGINLYRFKVFHSYTGKWILSSQRVFIRTDYSANKAVCTKGVIYWRCGNFLLWYDTKRDLAGSLALPVVEGSSKTGTNHVEVYAGKITFSRVLSGGIEVWRLTEGSHWERLHVASWDSMMDTFDCCHDMQLHHKSLSDMLFQRFSIRSVGFDGRFVYFVVRLKSDDNTEKLFGWETKTGQVKEKGLITANATQRTFKYVNNMAKVPQILNGSSN